MKSVRIPKKIEDISLRWVQLAPFLAEFTMRFYYHEAEKGEMEIPTMGVGVHHGRFNLYYDKEFLKKIPKNILEFVLIHEIMHIVSLHQERKMPERLVWNIATDMIINDNITTLKIAGRPVKCWKDAVYLDHAVSQGYQGEKISEELYEWLLKEYNKYKKKYGSKAGVCSLPKADDQSHKGGNADKKASGQNQKSGNSGKESSGQDQKSKGSDSPLKRMFKQMDAHEWLEKQLTEMDKKAVEEIVKSARMRSWGSMSGNMVEYLDKLTKDKTVNWRQLLRKYTNNWSWGKGPIRFRTWNKRNRRQLPLPGYKRPHNELVVAVDTSGSIDQEYFQMFFNEVESIAKDKDRLTILECDTKINNIYDKYRRGDYRKIRLVGRGGTNFAPVFDWMQENEKQKSLLIYFTDLYADWNFDTHGIHTIWCTPNENEDAPKDKGKTVHIKKGV